MTKSELEELTTAIATATRAAVTRLFQAHLGHEFYYCALVTTGEVHAPTLSAWSKQALAEQPEAERADIKWSYADSPFHFYGEEHFAPVHALFDRAGYAQRLRAMETALARLDAEGTFGRGSARLGIVINVEVAPPDHTNTARALRLNPRKALEAWLSEAAEPILESGDGATVERFVEMLAGACPTFASLSEHGLDAHDAEDIRSAFTCIPKSPTHDDWPNAVERLLATYDCSTVEISHVRFLAQPAQQDAGVQVAWWEADPIVVTEEGHIVATDHAEPSRVICRCANDGGGFLAGLGLLAAAISKSDEWSGREAELAAKCAALAGGDEYREFFRAIGLH